MKINKLNNHISSSHPSPCLLSLTPGDTEIIRQLTRNSCQFIRKGTEIMTNKNIFNKAEEYKKKIDAMRPFDTGMLAQIRQYYKIGLTWSSNALEGNSLTESETKVLLEEGLTVGGKPIRDYYEATGHAQAYEFMYDMAKDRPVSEEDIKTLHRLFYTQLDSSQAGIYRKEKVIITGSKYPTTSPDKIENMMKEFIEWLSVQESKLHPVEFAAAAHKKFVFIHPFIDGNGRVARLLMNLCLMRTGYTIAIIPPILRAEYIANLEKAHEDDVDFTRFIAARVVETQKELLRLLGE